MQNNYFMITAHGCVVKQSIDEAQKYRHNKVGFALRSDSLIDTIDYFTHNKNAIALIIAYINDVIAKETLVTTKDLLKDDIEKLQEDYQETIDEMEWRFENIREHKYEKVDNIETFGKAEGLIPWKFHDRYFCVSEIIINPEYLKRDQISFRAIFVKDEIESQLKTYFQEHIKSKGLKVLENNAIPFDSFIALTPTGERPVYTSKVLRMIQEKIKLSGYFEMSPFTEEKVKITDLQIRISNINLPKKSLLQKTVGLLYNLQSQETIKIPFNFSFPESKTIFFNSCSIRPDGYCDEEIISDEEAAIRRLDEPDQYPDTSNESKTLTYNQTSKLVECESEPAELSEEEARLLKTLEEYYGLNQNTSDTNNQSSEMDSCQSTKINFSGAATHASSSNTSDFELNKEQDTKIPHQNLTGTCDNFHDQSPL
ncbi:MAG: hypothetical protein SFT93_02210 [Rickettsiaceae bacterium]|nr:hypothetical protein [Rickettsiaceae bacterium]